MTILLTRALQQCDGIQEKRFYGQFTEMIGMIRHRRSAIKLPGLLCACLCAALLCISFGVVSDSRAQTKTQVCDALDISTEDCALITGVSTMPPRSIQTEGVLGVNEQIVNTPWLVTSVIEREGSSSMRSGDILHNQASCLVLAVALPAGTRIRFFLQTSSEAVLDRQFFAAGNRVLVRNFSPLPFSEDITLREWEELEVMLSGSVSTLTWCYVKNNQTEAGDDRGWLDVLSFSVPAPPLTQDVICSALDIDTDDCAMISSFASDPPDLPWYVSDINTTGGTSLRSGDIRSNQTSCLVLGVTLPANRVIRFSLRTDSEPVRDFLYFAAGDVRLIDSFTASPGSPLRNWEPQLVLLPDSVNTLRWCYSKDGSFAFGADSGWLDALSFNAAADLAAIPLYPGLVCPVLDMSADDCSLITGVSTMLPVGLALPLSEPLADSSTATNLSWFVSTETASQGDNSLRSGNIGNSQASCLVLGVTLPANSQIRFSLRTSSEGVRDRLAFFADNQLLIENFSAPEDSNLRNWQQLESTVTSSISNLTWCYLKDSGTVGTSTGADTGWLDALSFTLPPICTALDMSGLECTLITDVTYNPPESPWILSTTATAGDSSLRSGDIEDNQQSCLVLNLSLPDQTLVQFSRRASSQPVADRLFVSFNGNELNYDLRPAAATVLRDWSREVHILLQAAGNSSLSWCYAKNGSSSEGEDGAWLDDLSLIALSAAPLNREVVCLVLDMSAEDCALITSIAADPPDVPWVISDINTQGGTSLRSADIGNNQTNCLLLGITLPDDRRISFSLRTDAEPLNDFLYFEVGGFRWVDRFTNTMRNSNIRGWESEIAFLSSGFNALNWCYIKSISNSSGSDSGWLDRLSLNNMDDPSNIPLTREVVCIALDMSAEECALITGVTNEIPPSSDLNLPSGTPWVVGTIATEGSFSLRGADIGASEISCLVLNTALPANSRFSFSLRIEADSNTRISFYADLLIEGSIENQTVILEFNSSQGSTLRDWERFEFNFVENISALIWCYRKTSASTPVGANRGWLDDLSLIPPVTLTRDLLCPALDLSADDCALVTSISTIPSAGLAVPGLRNSRGQVQDSPIPVFAPWYVSPVTSRRGDTSLRSGNVDNFQASCLVLDVTLPANSRISFSLRVEAGSIRQGLSVFADNQLLLENFSASNWTQREYRVTSRISSLTWCYHKEPIEISNGTGIDDQTGWLDALVFTSSDIVSFCDVLDLPSAPCTLIRTVTYDPPQNRWESTTTDSLRGASALVTPPLDMSQNACVIIEFNDALPADNYLAFSWRVTSQSKQDILRFQAGNQQRQIGNAPQWQTEYIDLDSSENTVDWCYSRNSAEDRQTARAWLDSLLIVTPADRYAVQIAVTQDPTVPPARTDSFQFQVTVTAQSPTLPRPSDWVLIASGIDNISGADTTYALVFSGDPARARVNVIATPDNPLLPSTVHFTLADHPSFFGATAPMIRYSLPARELAMLQLMAPSTATQAVPDTPIEIAVTVAATDNSDIPVSPSGLTLMIEGTGNAEVSQSTYVLSFTAGIAQTTIAVSLITRGNTGSIELSVIRGDIVTTATIFLNPAPRKLASITVAAASSLVQTAADTPVTAELILTALDNYGDPTEGGNIDLQLSASNDAMVQTTWTLIIDATGTTRQTVEILPQNDLDTTVTVQLSRGSQDQSVQLLPDGGIQIVVQALRVLRQLQLSLADAQSPLRQIDQSRPIRADIRLIGLDQYDQPIAFLEVMLTAAGDPSATQLTLDPQQLSASQPAGAITELVVEFPDPPDAKDTTITISVASPGTEVTANELVVLALPDTRPPLPSLNVDSENTDITELDLIVALRWLADPQSSTASLAVNLTVTTANITATGRANLQRLFTESEFLDRVDVNEDGRVDQLDLRVLLRYLSGLRGTELAEQEVSEEIIELLLEQP